MQSMLKSIKLNLICSFVFLMMLAPSIAHATLAVTIGDGAMVTNSARIFTFSPNSAVVTGGSGSYSFVWSNVNDGIGTWSGGSGQSFSPQATMHLDCDLSNAEYSVTVTDTVTGAMATSNSANYSYHWVLPGHICP